MAGPLEGIKVLDFTIAQQGTYATLLLADMGADVLKVETPGTGDLGRAMAKLRGTDVSAFFLAMNRGKKGLTLNLKTPEGRAILAKLAPGCDVCVHNFQPGVDEKLGIDYEAMRRLNPKIVYASASAFGEAGPKSMLAGNDIVAQAASGLMSVTGFDDDYPLPVGVNIVDHIGAMTLALGIVTSLLARERTGEAQRVHTSLLGSAIAAQTWELTYHLLSGDIPHRGGLGHHQLPLIWQVFRTADDYLVLGGVDQARWSPMCAALGREDLIDDARFNDTRGRVKNRLELLKVLKEIFLSKTTEQWMRVLEPAGALCAPVQNYQQVSDDPQVQANNYIMPFQHSRLGEIRIPNTPISFDSEPGSAHASEPTLGEHTDEVLLGLGYKADEIDRFRTDGVI
jgi:crotonobetainyl-CoA:carnitine CoA-transferase CaiB-like acyl-CoA transferase